MKDKFNLILTILLAVISLSPEAAAQTGGQFKIEQSAIAAGGATNSTGGQFALGGTIGQTIAGQQANGAAFTLHAGFWTPAQFGPTAAGVTAGGRVKTADGRGIRNVIITITFPSGEQRSVISGTLGYYRFADIPASATYVFSVAAKRYTFNQPMQIRNITDDTQDIDFIADAPTNEAASGIAPQ